MYINNIFYMDKIIEIEKEISKKRSVVNLSNWNSSKHYENGLFKYITPLEIKYTNSYIYSYDIPIQIREKCIKKLTGKNANNKMCLFLGNSTLSIINVINFLKYNGCKKLLIINPSYFSVVEACKIFGLSYEIRNFSRVDDEYIIDPKIIFKEDYNAIWITSPIYSTSVKLSDNIIRLINSITKNKIFVVLDESTSVNGNEAIRKADFNQYLLGIYSPHKSIFCNSNKFSSIICSKKYDDFFEQWVDVLNGSLSSSNQQAINHFISDNFDKCNNYAIGYFNMVKRSIIGLLEMYPSCYWDNSIVGPYMSVYIRNVDINKIYSIDFIKKLINDTGVSFYPGFLNGISIPNTLNFRINLSLSVNQAVYSLKQLLDFIFEN